MSRPFAVRLPALVAASLMLPTLAACGSSSSSSGGAAPATPTPSAALTTSTGGVACSYVAGGSAAKKVNLPPSSGVIATGTLPAVLHMAAGDVAMTLDRAAAPCTVNSFASLAQQGYFSGTKCHRLTTEGIYVLQCGDPTASGSGGPGYSFKDELKQTKTYPAGTVAMANAGPNTNGSQFFLVYRDTQLPPSYTVFGHLDASGLSVVQKIANKGTSDGTADGTPAADAGITSVTVG